MPNVPLPNSHDLAPEKIASHVAESLKRFGYSDVVVSSGEIVVGKHSLTTWTTLKSATFKIEDGREGLVLNGWVETSRSGLWWFIFWASLVLSWTIIGLIVFVTMLFDILAGGVGVELKGIELIGLVKHEAVNY